jgi:hypothetical protein
MTNRITRSLLRAAAVTVTSAAALAAAGAAAHAAVPSGGAPAESGSRAAGNALLGAVQHLPVNPLAHTGVNPLDNTVGSQIADFKPVSTGLLTEPLADSRSVSELPVVGDTLNRLTS